MSEQRCPICSAAVEPNVRYRNYVCFDCCSKAVDENGRKLGFGNQSFSGGFVAWYADTKETRDTISVISTALSAGQTKPTWAALLSGFTTKE